MQPLGLNLFRQLAVIDHLICELCEGVFRDPVVDSKGKSFCKYCVDNPQHHPTLFPNGDVVKAVDMTPNLIVKKYISSLEIKCPNFVESCPWEGLVENLNVHLKTCPFAIVKCANNGCNETYKNSEDEAHQAVCPKRPTSCTHCSNSVPFDELEKHIDLCPLKKLPCALKCGCEIERRNMQTHLAESCPRKVVSCDFREAGCCYQDSKDKIDEHMKKHFQHHLKTQGEQIINQEVYFNKSLSAIIDAVLTNDNATQTSKIETYKTLLAEFQAKKQIPNISLDANFNKEHIEIYENTRKAKNLTTSKQGQTAVNQLKYFERVTFVYKDNNSESSEDYTFGVGVSTIPPSLVFTDDFFKIEHVNRAALVTNRKKAYVKESLEDKFDLKDFEFPLNSGDCISMYIEPDFQNLVFENLTQGVRKELTFETDFLTFHLVLVLGPNVEITLKDHLEWWKSDN